MKVSLSFPIRIVLVYGVLLLTGFGSWVPYPAQAQTATTSQETRNLDQIPLAFRRAVELAGGGKPLSFSDLINLVRQQTPENEILARLKALPARPALTPDQMRELTAAGAPPGVLAWLRTGPNVFRLVEVRVSRGYGFNFQQPDDKPLFAEKDVVFQELPDVIETGGSRSWYDERLSMHVDAPETVEDGQIVKLKSVVRTVWDFRLKEPNTNIPYYVATQFKYQPQASKSKSGTPEQPVTSGQYTLETESVVDVTVSGGDATLGGFGPDGRSFYVRGESGVGGSQAMIDAYFIYRRDPAPDPNAALPADPVIAKSNAHPDPASGTGNVSEPTGLILKAPHVKVARGSTVLIPVELLNAQDVLNLDFAMAFSPEIASPNSTAEKGSLVSEIFQYNLNTPGQFKFNFAQLKPVHGNGTVAGFRFTATGPGASRTPLGLSVHTVNDSGGNPLPITTIDGSISIYDPNNPNDPNHPAYGTGTGTASNRPSLPTCSGSGQQTVNDAQCCLKMWVELIPRGMHMDLDSSGEVDSRDAVMVLRNVQQSLIQRSQ